MDETTTTQAPQTTTTPTAEEASDKRDRRVFPIAIFSKGDGGGWVAETAAPTFTKDAEARAWCEANIKPGRSLMAARVHFALRVPPTSIEEVSP